MSEPNEEADWVPFTIRLPKATHEWLQHEAFFGRTTMSAIVREEVGKRMALSGGAHAHAVRRGPDQAAPGTEQVTGTHESAESG